MVQAKARSSGIAWRSNNLISSTRLSLCKFVATSVVAMGKRPKSGKKKGSKSQVQVVWLADFEQLIKFIT